MRVPYYKMPAQNPAAGGFEKQMSWSAYLLRPYLDLGVSEHSPLHAQSVASLGQEILRADDQPVAPYQLNTLTMLRPMLLAESRLDAYACEDPRQLPEELRTPAWQHLCEMLEGWEGLTRLQKDNAALLLNRLGFYKVTTELLAPVSDEAIAAEETEARLAGRYANALLKVHPDHSLFAEQTLMRIAKLRPAGSQVRFLSAISLVVHFARTAKDADQVREWSEFAAEEFRHLQPETCPLHRLFASAYYRAVSFLPFLRGDREETVRQLGLAEEWAKQIPTDDPLLRVLHDENWHPLLETRAREALWLGDFDLAMERTRRLVEHDPFDAKVHMRLGNLYLKTGRFEEALACFKQGVSIGAPYTAHNWFLVGHCYQELGDLNNALDAYLQATGVDRFGISPLLRISALAERLGRPMLKRWSHQQLERLRQLG